MIVEPASPRPFHEHSPRSPVGVLGRQSTRVLGLLMLAPTRSDKH